MVEETYLESKNKKKPNTLSIEEYLLYPVCGRIGTI